MPQTFPPSSLGALWLRWFSILWGRIDMAFAGLLPTQWVVRGGCKKTGECCKLIALELPGLVRWRFFHVFFTRWGRWWNEKINGFTYAGILNDRYLSFTCKRLADDGTCMDYGNRPRVCREYPSVGFFGRPRLAKGCGYSIVLRATKPKLYRDADR